MFKLAICLTFVLLTINPACAQDKWKWADEHASILHYFAQAPNNYQIELIKGVKADRWDLEMRITSGAKTLHRWKTHSEGAFVIKDATLIYAEFHMMSSGCELRAYDLDQQKEIWRTPLDGLGPISHSKYRNRINMEIQNDRVVVYGNESSGQYIESRDLKTGELIDHVIGQGQYGRFKENQ